MVARLATGLINRSAINRDDYVGRRNYVGCESSRVIGHSSSGESIAPAEKNYSEADFDVVDVGLWPRIYYRPREGGGQKE